LTAVHDVEVVAFVTLWAGRRLVRGHGEKEGGEGTLQGDERTWLMIWVPGACFTRNMASSTWASSSVSRCCRNACLVSAPEGNDQHPGLTAASCLEEHVVRHGALQAQHGGSVLGDDLRPRVEENRAFVWWGRA
jgi:hypothetical protein